MNRATVEFFKEHFKGKNAIPLLDIKSFLYKDDPELDDATLRKEIYKLRKKGVLLSLKRGVYKIADKPLFCPDPDKHIQKICRLFLDKFPEISFCIWSTQWLHQFMNLQPFRFFYILESEKDVLEPTFYFLKDHNINAFLKPDKSMVEKYVNESSSPVVIKPLTSRSPLQQINNLQTASLEKMLVDLFCDSDIFYAYQGNELSNIFKNAFHHFHIDYSKLLNYAGRRKQKEKLTVYLKTHVTD